MFLKNYLINLDIDDFFSSAPPISCSFFEEVTIDNLNDMFRSIDPLVQWLFTFVNDHNPDYNQSTGIIDTIIQNLIFKDTESAEFLEKLNLPRFKLDNG